MKIDKYEFPEDLYYEPNHIWARIEDGLAVVGISDYAQEEAGEIIFFEAPTVGEMVVQGKSFASIESGKWVGRIYAPVSGEIVEVNRALVDDAAPINKDPYGAGWLAKIKPTDLSELDKIFRVDDPEFARWFKEQLGKEA